MKRPACFQFIEVKEKCCYLNFEMESEFVLNANGSRYASVCMGYKGRWLTYSGLQNQIKTAQRKKEKYR